MATIYITRGTTSLGTFSEEEVHEGLRNGRFALTDLAWREGMASWETLSKWPEFGGAASNQVAPTSVAPPLAVTTVGRTEPLAIWSFVLSLVGLFCCGFILGIPAVILGHLALSKFQKEPHLQGRGLAIAGLVIGYVGIAFWLIYVVFCGGLAFLQGISQSITK